MRLLPVVVPGRDLKSFPTRLADTVGEILAAYDVSPALIAEERATMTSVHYARTDDQRTVGLLVEMEEGRSPSDRQNPRRTTIDDEEQRAVWVLVHHARRRHVAVLAQRIAQLLGRMSSSAARGIACMRTGHVAVTMDEVPVERATRRGLTSGSAIQHELVGQSRERIGQLQVFVADGADRAEAEALLAFLVPSGSMALSNAITFRVVEDYRKALERRVAARTRDLNTARDELTATVHRLEEVQLDRERLFQNISHEIRTPLVLILLAIDAVLDAHRPRLDARSIDHLDTVTTSARKLVRLVDELLLLAAGRDRELTVSAQPLALAP